MAIKPTIHPFITRTDKFAVLADWGGPAPVDAPTDIDWNDVLESHKEGGDRIGMYTPDINGFTRWACIDIDGGDGHKNPVEDPDQEQNRVTLSLLSEGFQPFIEKSASGEGWHIWVFFDEMVPAADVIDAMKEIAGVNELFPKSKGGKETGNMVWLPWWGGDGKGGELIDPLMGSNQIRYSNPPAPSKKRKEITRSAPTGKAKESDVLAALMFLDPDMHHDDWIKVLMGIKHGLGPDRGKEIGEAWSSMGLKWDSSEFDIKWESLSAQGGTTVGTLFWKAKESGWEGPPRPVIKEVKGTNPPPISKEPILPTDNSDITIAECVVANLGQVQGGDGSLYTYQPSGIWEPMSTGALEREIHEYNNVRIGDKPLLLGDQKVRGIRRRVEAIVGLHEQWPGNDVGVTFLNGHLNELGELVPQCPANFSRVFIPCEYTGTYGPFWPNQIRRMAGEAHDFLQEFAGACLMGVAPNYKKLAMLYGPKDSGKSTFLMGLLSLFSETTAVPISPQDIIQEHQRARIAGARLCFMDDMSSATFYNTGPFKSVVSGSPTDGRHKYGQPFRFTPRAGWLLATNQLPNTTDVTRGFFERFAIVECFNILLPEDIIPGFDKIVESYRAEIAAWAVEGFQRLQVEQKYSLCPGKAPRDWMALQDPFIAFLDDEVIRMPETSATVKDTYAAYSRWSSRNNIPRSMGLTMRAFEMRLVREAFSISGNKIQGIALKNKNF